MAPFPWGCNLERATVWLPSSGTFSTVPQDIHIPLSPRHPCTLSCDDPPHPSLSAPLGFKPQLWDKPWRSEIFCRNPRKPGRHSNHQSAGAASMGVARGAALHPNTQTGASPSFSHCRDATPPTSLPPFPAQPSSVEDCQRRGSHRSGGAPTLKPH